MRDQVQRIVPRRVALGLLHRNRARRHACAEAAWLNWNFGL